MPASLFSSRTRSGVARRARALLAGPESLPDLEVGPLDGTSPWHAADDEACEPLPDLPRLRPGAHRPDAPRRGVRRRPMGLEFASALRLDPGRRAAMALGLVAVVVALLTLAWLLVDRPRSMSVSRTAKDVARASATTTIPSTATTPFSKTTPSNGASVTTGSSPSSRSASAVAPGVVVDVVGHVSRPGVYELPAGARVTDALTAAGGALPGVDLTGLNLASKLTDGQQVAVGIGGLPPAVASVSPASGSPAAPVNLNTASVADLDGLPGVGPVLAQHIIDWRTQHGHFDSVDQLREVTGIGPAKFTDLKALVTV